MIKATAEDVARLDGDVGRLTQAHLDSAAAVLNSRPRSRTASATSAAGLWATRPQPSQELRRDLHRRYRRHERARRSALGIAEQQTLNHAEQASLDRYAIPEALCELDLLLIRRR